MKKILINLILITMLLVIYQFIHMKLNINSTVLPSIIEIIKSFFSNWESLILNLIYSIFETVVGLVMAVLFSIIVSIFINENKYFKKYVLKVIYIFQMIPLIAITPLIIIWLGRGIESRLLLIVLYSSFPIIISLVESFENISTSHKLYIQTLTDNKAKIYNYLYFPLSYEQFFAGIKIATTYGLACTIIVECLGSNKGIGVLLNRAYFSYETDLLFCIIFLIVGSTFTMLKIVQLIQQKIRR